MLLGMARQRGFTLTELLITISVMVILMTLAVVSVRSTQLNARDEERKTDIENIARGLERRYIEGGPTNPLVTMPWPAKGSYPGTKEMLHAMGASQATFNPTQVSGGYLTALLPGTTDKTFQAPNNTSGISFDMWCTTSCTSYNSASLATTMASINSFTTINKYTYSPVDRNNNICYNGDCVKFFLYYRSEVDGQLYTIKSKNQ